MKKIIAYCYLLSGNFLSVDTLYVQRDIPFYERKQMDILKVFAQNVRHYRNQIGISQEDFAEKCGLHRTYISAVERQKRSISLNNVQKIADALGIETYRLFIEPKDTDKRSS